MGDGESEVYRSNRELGLISSYFGYRSVDRSGAIYRLSALTRESLHSSQSQPRVE